MSIECHAAIELPPTKHPLNSLAAGLPSRIVNCCLKEARLPPERLEFGDRAAVLFIDEQLVGTVWISTKTYHDWDTDLKIELQPNEAWLYGAWIHRKFRGQQLYSSLIAHVCESLQQPSIDSILLAVDWSNGLSQNVHEALGAERIGSLYGLCIFGLRHFRLNR